MYTVHPLGLYGAGLEELIWDESAAKGYACRLSKARGIFAAVVTKYVPFSTCEAMPIALYVRRHAVGPDGPSPPHPAPAGATHGDPQPGPQWEGLPVTGLLAEVITTMAAGRRHAMYVEDLRPCQDLTPSDQIVGETRWVLET